MPSNANPACGSADHFLSRRALLGGMAAAAATGLVRRPALAKSVQGSGKRVLQIECPPQERKRRVQLAQLPQVARPIIIRHRAAGGVALRQHLRAPQQVVYARKVLLLEK